MMRALAILLLFAPALVAAPVPKELRKELKIEGIWEMVSINSYGREHKFKRGLHWSFDEKGNMTSGGDIGIAPIKSSLQFEFHRDDKTVEYRFGDGLRVCPGLFEMEGDTLIICCNLKAKGERPKAIGTGPENYVWTMRRARVQK